MADFEDNPIKSGSMFSEARFQDNEKRFQDGEKRFEDKIDFSKEASFGGYSHANFQEEEKKSVETDKPDDIQNIKVDDKPKIEPKDTVSSVQATNNFQKQVSKKYTQAAEQPRSHEYKTQNNDFEQSGSKSNYRKANATYNDPRMYETEYGAEKEVNTKVGLFSLVLGILAIIFSCSGTFLISLILAVPTIFVAKKVINNENKTEKALAIIGIVLSAIAILIASINFSAGI